ncbi:aldehyde dehydrogenase family protein [Roseiconus lacunae]|uniref:aldehyde dehydrogenase family protein n=1 Tax=Roseiconus lacunae TaxID=2605694 RepID=UPI0030929C7D|nr:aldehyde dehydrogenase family protein [Stieleria sp. HD01]
MIQDDTLRQRCRRIASIAPIIVERCDEFVDACSSDWRVDPVETITGELLPFCSSLRWLGKHGGKALRSRSAGRLGRPLWLSGVTSVIERVPHGDVLVLGTWNYPVLLPGVQIAQALAAGNTVQFKPAAGTERSAEILVDCFRDVGFDQSKLRLLGSDVESATGAIDAGVDLIVLTGSAATGQNVLARSSSTLAASIMELSGCDAVLAIPGCDTGRLVKAIRFGLTFNGGATCIGPRRLLVLKKDRDKVVGALTEELKDASEVVVHPAARGSLADNLASALRRGANETRCLYDEQKLRTTGRIAPLVLTDVKPSDPIANADIFAPVISVIEVDRVEAMIDVVNKCDYRLAASVFGPEKRARSIAERLRVGTVVINDLIAPTADPRLPFGGRGKSGFGVTRGREGLLAMTTIRVVSSRRGRMTPHLDRRTPRDRGLLQGLMTFLHGRGLQKRVAGLKLMQASVKTKADEDDSS